MGRRNSKRRIPAGKEGWTAAEGIPEPVTKRICRRACGACFTRTRFYDTHRRRQLYTGADATLMEAALNLCEWRLKHNIKTAAFERLSKLLKKHMLPKDGSTET
eukprot:jgi/Tetstr1/444895/TSEL_032733.t1